MSVGGIDLVISITINLTEGKQNGISENGRYTTKWRKAEWLLIWEVNIANYLDSLRSNEEQNYLEDMYLTSKTRTAHIQNVV